MPFAILRAAQALFLRRIEIPFMRLPISARHFTVCFLACFAGPLPAQQKPAQDYSREAYVIEKVATTVEFSADGTQTREITAAVRVQSDAAVRSFGLLEGLYKAETERLDIAYVRVRKPGGRTIETPQDSIQDIPPEITRSAPTYSDIREKQIPVKALGAGDLLEYTFRWTSSKPEIANQFWFNYDFHHDDVVLQETLEISTPANKYIKLDTPQLRPQVREEGGRKIYVWKTAQLKPSESDAAKTQAGENTADKQDDKDATPHVRLTTFRDWQEVGAWYSNLQSARLELTPAIKAKAAELTAGLISEDDKERAIYKYVSTNFRYISISFGYGRYQPHAADEVLSNQYGDCKDKHTLFAALLKAAGIEAWPALIGAGIEFEEDIPSPAQFNHVITVLPQQNGYLWLDTTPEVAPFGMLTATIMDQKALIIPASRPAVVTKTPQGAIFRSANLLAVRGTLDKDGTLTAHIDITLHGDAELYLRSGFHEIAPVRWRELVQEFSRNLGYSGEVSNVTADSPENLDKPFHFAYDYKRANYADWENRRITPPFPPFDVTGTDQTQPKEPVSIGFAGESTYRAEIQLPKDYSAQIPANVDVHTNFADYQASYSVSNGTLHAERRLAINQSKPPLTAWHDYIEFSKKVINDENQFIPLSSSTETAAAPAEVSNPQAAQLVQDAYTDFQNREINAARDALEQAEHLNPNERGLWAMHGALDMAENRMDSAIDFFEKEIEIHPENIGVYRVLAGVQMQAGRPDAAVETMHQLVNRDSANTDTLLEYTSLLAQHNRYADILTAIEKPLIARPDDTRLQVLRVEAFLHTGRKGEGVAAARKLADAKIEPMLLNNIAYMLADTKADGALAREYAEKAVADLETASKDVKLADLTDEDLSRVNEMAAAWDTLGWAYHALGDDAKAQPYIDASWKLCQHGDVGDHLGQIYEQQGKHQAAIHMWRLALAANGKLDDTRNRLRQAGASEYDRPGLRTVKKTLSAATPVDPPEELGKLRTSGVPSLPKQTGSAEFFLLFSSDGLEDVQFISGEDSLKNAATSLHEVHYDLPFPDHGPEKIARRAILSCSTLTNPSCQVVFLLPANTRK